MINNRQNGRRRGRGNPQARNGSGGNGPERGNRIDNRARGNAAQLHEKYKNLARDAQTQGDRVMTEYYLQFADHYFRVLGESRARFEEQNPNQQGQHQQRRPNGQQDGFDDDGSDDNDNDFGDAEMVAEPRRFDREPPRRDNRDDRGNREEQVARDDARDDRGNRDDRGSRDDRNARDDRSPRNDRGNRDDGYREPRQDVVAAAPAPVVEQQEEAPRPRRGRPRRRPEGEDAPAPVGAAQPREDRAPRIDADRLPPAFAPVEAVSAAPGDGEGDDPAPRRRRVRRPSSEDNVAA